MEASVVFVSIFLSLTAGIHPIEVAVDGPVAEVEIVLDGKQVAIMQGAPWQMKCDFGDELVPHELTAIARDSEGKELARTGQLVNLPRGNVECRLLLFRDEQRRPQSARLVWQSTERATPDAIHVTLDGIEIDGIDPHLFQLPSYNPDRYHFLSAELEFGATVCRAESSFSGIESGEVRTDLTAVPIIVEDGAAEPTAVSLQGLLQVRGESVPVVAVDNGGASLFVVRDRAAIVPLAVLEEFGRRKDSLRRKTLNSQLSKAVRRTSGDRVVIINPRAKLGTEAGASEVVFPTSSSFNLTDKGLHWLLTRIAFTEPTSDKQRLADAVAAAAVRAAATKARRAVLLVIDARVQDSSQFTPEMVVRYLKRIQVPLVVWQTSASKKATRVWGESRSIGNYNVTLNATKELQQLLASQRIAWLQGQYLPNEITLSASARGMRLAINDEALRARQ
jgi:hypothetical protein